VNLLCRFIHWTEQNFPKGGREGNVVSLIKQCAKLFKDDERYRSDDRYINIWIKFVSTFCEICCRVITGWIMPVVCLLGLAFSSFFAPFE